ncbi:type II toxin-antitoxin system VapC family toxin [Achromobacter piechaudii]|uniref:type II toxin-antitoxin system VapC family toxin n=1 Tax=Achromobacter piechaudii TaxID=72556 RepID=UPI003DA84898
MKTVLDASVALAWLLVRNDASEAMLATHLLKRARHFQIFVPRHWHVEVGNGMLRTQRARAVSADAVAAFVDVLECVAVQQDRPHTADTWRATHRIASTHGLTAYDAAYVELAARSGSHLATFDKKLADAARAHGVAVLGQPHGVAEPLVHYG